MRRVLPRCFIGARAPALRCFGTFRPPVVGLQTDYFTEAPQRLVILFYYCVPRTGSSHIRNGTSHGSSARPISRTDFAAAPARHSRREQIQSPGLWLSPRSVSARRSHRAVCGRGGVARGPIRFLYFTFTSRRFNPTRLPRLNEADSQMAQVQSKASSSTCRRELARAFRSKSYICVRSAMKSGTVSAKYCGARTDMCCRRA